MARRVFSGIRRRTVPDSRTVLEAIRTAASVVLLAVAGLPAVLRTTLRSSELLVVLRSPSAELRPVLLRGSRCATLCRNRSA